MQTCRSRLFGLSRTVRLCRTGSLPRHHVIWHKSNLSSPPVCQSFKIQRRYIRNAPRQDGYSKEPEAAPSSQPVEEELSEAELRQLADLADKQALLESKWVTPPSAGGIFRAFAWTCGIGLLSFSAASYLEKHDDEDLAKSTRTRHPTPLDLAKAKQAKAMTSAIEGLASLQDKVPFFVLSVYSKGLEWWLNLDEGKRVGAGITALNALVFLAWQLPHPAARAFMTRHFTHHPLSGKYYTMLTSCFSHAALWHFGLNMYAMQNFLAATDHYISSVQAQDPDVAHDDPDRRHRAIVNSSYKTLAFFVTAGVFSSFGLHAIVNANLMRKMRTMPFEAAIFNSHPIKPSLGASGAIYATVTCTTLAWPESSVNMFFAIPLPITYGTASLVALDVMGLLRGWRLFAHEAHLAGAAFGGMFYAAAPYFNAAASTKGATR